MGQLLYQIVQNMLNQVLSMVNTPGNAYYLPTWVTSNNFDPYGKNIGMKWGVTLTDPGVIEAAAGICPTVDIVKSVCSGQSSGIGAPNNNPTLVLGSGQPGDMLVTGASNAYLATLSLPDPNLPFNIVGTGSISTLPSPLPQNLVITGDFTFTQWCCCSLDNTTCCTTPAPVVGTGTFTATVNGPCQVMVNFSITDLAPGVLNIGVTSMTFTPPMQAGTQTPNITVTVDITGIPVGANRQSYNNMAEEAFNSPTALQNVNQQINAVMNAQEQLTFMGNLLTNLIDGYLKANNLYPFGPPTLAVF
jgi:hypothetical protein